MVPTVKSLKTVSGKEDTALAGEYAKADSASEVGSGRRASLRLVQTPAGSQVVGDVYHVHKPPGWDPRCECQGCHEYLAMCRDAQSSFSQVIAFRHIAPGVHDWEDTPEHEQRRLKLLREPLTVPVAKQKKEAKPVDLGLFS